jgi:mono/diheme cytochrome c family protein
MMSRTLIMAVVGAAVLAAAAGFWLQSADEETLALLQPEDATVVARGAKLYAANCASCHGADLSGEPGWPDWRRRKPDGRLAAPPHDESGHTWHHPDEVLFQITKLGTAAFLDNPDLGSDMPVFGETLTDSEIAAVLSYIKSTWKGQAKEANARINQQATQQK